MLMGENSAQRGLGWVSRLLVAILLPLVYSGSQDQLNAGELDTKKVNGPPELVLPLGPLVVSEDNDLSLAGLDVGDPDAIYEHAGVLEVTISAQHGVLALTTVTGLQSTVESGSAMMAGERSQSITFIGSMEHVSSAMHSLIYRGVEHFTGSDAISVKLSDLGHSGAGDVLSSSAVVDIQVTAVNDAPVLLVVGSFIQKTIEDAQLLLHNVVVSDPDLSTDDLTVLVKAEIGFLTLPSTAGVLFSLGDGFNDTITEFSGSLAAVNLALAGVQYLCNANANGLDTVVFTVSDNGHSGSGGVQTSSASVRVEISAVNDAPTISAPFLATVEEDVALDLNSVSIADVDAVEGFGGMLEVRLEVSHGVLSVTQYGGLQIVDGEANGSALLALRGGLLNLNRALQTLVYLSDLDYNGADALQITVDDLGNVGSGGALNASHTMELSIKSVNDAPTLIAPENVLYVGEDMELDIAGLLLVDPDAGNKPLRLRASASNGIVSFVSDGLELEIVTDKTSGERSEYRGRIKDLASLLSTMRYIGNSDFAGLDRVMVIVFDNDGASSSAFVNIVVTPVNDAPSLNLPLEAGSLVLHEDVITRIPSISISDVDMGGDCFNPNEIAISDVFSAQLSAAHGLLSVADSTGIFMVSGNLNGSATLSFRGTLENLNNALKSLSYMSSLNFNGEDIISLEINDLGNIGSGGPLSAMVSIAVSVSSVEDPLIAVMPSGVLLTIEDAAPMSIDGVEIIHTKSESSVLLEVTVSATHGTVSVPQSDSVAFHDGFTSGVSITMVGLLKDANNVLSELHYAPFSNFNGLWANEGRTNTSRRLQVYDIINQRLSLEELSLTVHSLAPDGSVVATSASSCKVSVDWVNDPPSITTPEDVIFQCDEDTPTPMFGVSVHDVDVSETTGALLRVKLSSVIGQLSIDRHSLSWWAVSLLSGGDNATNRSVGASAIELEGPVERLNGALATLFYHPAINFVGLDTVIIVANDGGNSGPTKKALETVETVAVTIHAVDDAAVIILPQTGEERPLSVDEDNDLWLHGLMLDDPDASLTDAIQFHIVAESKCGEVYFASSTTGVIVQPHLTSTSYSQMVVLTATDDGEVVRAKQRVAASVLVQAEHQRIETSVDSGVVSGSFRISILGLWTSSILHDADASVLEHAIESLNGVGDVHVDRSIIDALSETYRWDITFYGLTGDVDELRADGTGTLLGDGSFVAVKTVQEGNELGGTFMLQHEGYSTSDITYDASALVVKNALEQLPSIGSVEVNLGGAGLSDSRSGNVWDITFGGSNKYPSNVGEIQLLSANYHRLTGIGAVVEVTHLVQGVAPIWGTFTLSLSGVSTIPIPHDATAEIMEQAIKEIADVDVVVSRSPNVAGGIAEVGHVWRVDFLQSISPATLTPNSMGLSTPGAVIVSPVAVSVTLTGLVSEINDVLRMSVYRSAPDRNSVAHGRDLLSFSFEDIDGVVASSFTSIHVNAVNDAPRFVGIPASFVTSEDTACLIANGMLDVHDPDLEDTAGATIFLRASTSHGTISLPSLAGVRIEDQNTADVLRDSSSKEIELSGSIQNVGVALSTIRYHPPTNWNSVDSPYGSTREVQTVCTMSDVPMEIRTISTILSSGSISGTFTLKLTVASYSENGVLLNSASDVTEPINFNAVPSIADEDSSAIAGLGLGESLESKLTAISNWPSNKGVSLRIRRTPLSLQNTCTWEVSFFNTAWRDTYSLTLVSSNLVGGANENPSVIIDVARTGDNVLGGSFIITHAFEYFTDPIAFNASEAEITEALQMLPTIGSIVVDRTQTNVRSQSFCWDITFLPSGTPSHIGYVELLAVKSTALVGFGATVTISRTTPGTAYYDEILLFVSDGGASGQGEESLSSTASISVKVSPVNDPPTIILPSEDLRPYTTEEDSYLLISGISVIDDAPFDSLIHVSLSALHGSLNLHAVNGVVNDLVFMDGSREGSSQLAFEATVGAATAVLSVITYTGNADWNGLDTITITASDEPSSLLNDHKETEVTFQVLVSPINDGPILTSPESVSVSQGSEIYVNGVSLTDLDVKEAPFGMMKIRVSAIHGFLSFDSAVRYSFRYLLGSGQMDPIVEIEGTIVALNAALGTLSYQSAKNWFGSDKIFLSVDDGGNTGSGGALSFNTSIAVSVQPSFTGPVLTLPTSNEFYGVAHLFSVFEDESLSLLGCNVHDIIALSQPTVFEVTFVSGFGGISVGKKEDMELLRFDIGAPGTWNQGTTKFSGPLQAVNKALNSVTYSALPNWNGFDTVSIAIRRVLVTNDKNQDNNLGITTQILHINVMGVNDAPIVMLAHKDSLYTLENEDVSLSEVGVTVADEDVPNDNGVLVLTLTASNGYLTTSLAGVRQLVGDATIGSANISLKGKISHLNNALASAVYHPSKDWHGEEIVEITVSDFGNANEIDMTPLVSYTERLFVKVVSVNSAPAVHIPPGVLITNEHTQLLLKEVRVTDVDVALELLKVSIWCTSGSLNFATDHGVAIIQGSGYDETSVVFEATLKDANIALASLIYTSADDFFGWDAVTISVDDMGSTGSGGSMKANATIPIYVRFTNHAPLLLSPNKALAVLEGSELGLTSFVLQDSNEAHLKESSVFLLDISAQHGVVELRSRRPQVWCNENSEENKTNVLNLMGSLDALNDIFVDDRDGIIFIPDPGWHGNVALSVTLYDQGHGFSEEESLFDTSVVTILVQAVNDAPILTLPKVTVFELSEEEEIRVEGVSLFDEDSANEVFLVSLGAVLGTLRVLVNENVRFIGNHSNANSVVVFEASYLNANNALASLTYTALEAANGWDTITIEVSEQGATGYAKEQHATGSITMHIQSVNNPPTVIVPQEILSTAEDEGLEISGVLITDVDAMETPGEMMQAVVQVNYGTVTLRTVDGIYFEFGTGTADSSVTMKGSLSQINLALSKLTYMPLTNWDGIDKITVSANDLGNTGIGSPGTHSRYFSISVVAVNDAPMLELPEYRLEVNEDTVLIVGIEAGGAISVHDNDLSTTDTLLVTLHSLTGRGRLLLPDTLLEDVVVVSNTSGDLAFRATEYEAVFALSELRYHGDINWYGEDTILVTVSDGELESSGSFDVRVRAVNDLPIIHMSNSELNVDEDTKIAVNGFSVTDVDGSDPRLPQGGVFTFKISAVSGTVSIDPIPGLFITSVGTCGLTVSFKSALKTANAALSSLTYISALNYFGSDTITLNVIDGENMEAGDEVGIEATIEVVVRAVNDAPFISAPTSITARDENEDLPLYDASGLSVHDVDAGIGALLVSISASNGIIDLSSFDGLEFLEGSGVADSIMSFRGSLNAINKALLSIVYRGANNFHGVDTITVFVNDEGHSGETGMQPLNASATFALVVADVNTSPFVSLSPKLHSAVVVEEDTWISLAGISVDDADVGDTANGHLEITISASHNTTLEIQTITTTAEHINTLQTIAVNPNGASMDATFTLALDCSSLNYARESTAPILFTAIASTHSEVSGTGNSAHSFGESLQSKLEMLTCIRAMNIQVEVQKDQPDGSEPNPAHTMWTITFFNAPPMFPLLSLDLMSDPSASVVISTNRHGNFVGGEFALEFEGKATSLIPHDASAMTVKRALEHLPTIALVDVRRSSITDREGGFEWRVTFFDPPGDVGSLKPVSAKLTGDKAMVIVNEIRRGRGIPELQQVTTNAFHVDEVQIVRTYAASNGVAISGGFTLSLDLSSIGGSSAVTALIDHDAVARKSDEATTWTLGTGRGESMEAKLEGLANMIEVTSLYSSDVAMSVSVTRTDQVCTRKCKAIPSISKSLSPSCTQADNCDICVGWCVNTSPSVVAEKQVVDVFSSTGLLTSGLFALTFDDSISEVHTLFVYASGGVITSGSYALTLDGDITRTPCIFFDASSNDVATALEALPSIGEGSISVTRTIVTANFVSGIGYKYHITYTANDLQGSLGTVVQESSTAKSGAGKCPAVTGECSDLSASSETPSAWADANGATCLTYATNKTDEGRPFCDVYGGTVVGNNNMFANQACCVCGGGSTGTLKITAEVETKGAEYSSCIQYGASETQFAAALATLSLVPSESDVVVERDMISSPGDTNGYRYHITFLGDSVSGDIPQLSAVSSGGTLGASCSPQLDGNAQIVVHTTSPGGYGIKTSERCVVDDDCGGGDLQCMFTGNYNDQELSGSCLSRGTACTVAGSQGCVGSGVCEVTDCAPDAAGGRTWHITFHNAPHNLPMLTVATNKLVAADTPNVKCDIVIDRPPEALVEGNGVGGTFALTFGGATSQPLAHDASAEDVTAALLALPSIKSTALRIGSVVVARGLPDLEGGIQWTIAFTEETPGGHFLLTADSTKLSGYGVSVSASKIRNGGRGGIFSLQHMNGVVVSEGHSSGGSDEKLVFYGSLSAVNAVLSGLSYRGKADWHGDVVVIVEADDLGNTGTGGSMTHSALISIEVLPVNDAPVLMAPAYSTPVLALEDIDLSLGKSIDITDVDSSDAYLECIVVAHHGVLFSALVSSDPSSQIIFRGTAEDISSAFETLTYRSLPNYNGVDNITITAKDGHGGEAQHTLLVDVKPVNDPPVVILPSAVLNFDEDEDVVIEGISIIDVDIEEFYNTLSILELMLAVKHGVLAFNTMDGLHVVEGDAINGSPTLRVRGSLASLNAAIQTCRYSPHDNWFGKEHLSIKANDLGNTGGEGARSHAMVLEINIAPVNDEPVIMLPPSPLIATEDDHTTIPSIRITDVDIDPIYVPIRYVRTSALHVDEVQIVRTYAASNGVAISGGFTLSLDLSSIGGSSAVTPLIDHDAVARKSDEATTWTLGTGRGESMEAKLEGLANMIEVTSLYSSDVAMSVSVTRTDQVCTRKCKAIPSISKSLSPSCTQADNCDICVGWCVGVSGVSGSSIKTSERCVVDDDCGGGDLQCMFTGNYNDQELSGSCLSRGTACTVAGSQGCVGSGVCEVTDCAPDAAGGRTWHITFHNAPHNLPMLTVETNKLVAADTPNVKCDIVIDRPPQALVEGNGVGGTFALTFGGATSQPLAHDASAEDVAAALLALPLGHQLVDNAAGTDLVTTKASTGALSVTRSRPTLEGGFTWTLAFELNHPHDRTWDIDALLIPNGTALTGHGAGVLVEIDHVARDSTNVIDWTLKVEIYVEHGLFSLTHLHGLSFSEGDGELDAHMIFEGTPENINRALLHSVYRPLLNWNSKHNGFDTINFTASDFGFENGSVRTPALSSKAILLALVNPVNDAPVVSLPGQQLDPVEMVQDGLSHNIASVDVYDVYEDVVNTFTGVAIRDVDVSKNLSEHSNSLLEVTLSSANGTLSLPHNAPIHSYIVGPMDGSFAAALSFYASEANANEALRWLRYVSDYNFNGGDHIVVSVSDLGNSGAGGILMDTQTIPVFVHAVNDAPEITLPFMPLSCREDDELVVSGITIDDVDFQDDTFDANGQGVQQNLLLTLSVANGRYTLTRIDGLHFILGDGELDAFMKFTGTPVDVTRALADSVYRPNPNFNTLRREEDVVTITVNDNAEDASDSLPSKTVMAKFYVGVAPVNDPPVVHLPNARWEYVMHDVYEIVEVETLIVEEDIPIKIDGIRISDIDVDEAFGGVLEITLTAGNGVLELATTAGLYLLEGVGNGLDSEMRFKGGVDSINTALSSVKYTGKQDFNGNDNLTVRASDEGNTGGGDVQYDEAIIPIHVRAVNDFPLWEVPHSSHQFLVDEDAGLAINNVQLHDVDAGPGINGEPESHLKITIAVGNGVVSLRSLVGLVFAQGNGTLDRSVTFTGTLRHINAALHSLLYTPDPHWNSMLGDRDTISFTADDLGPVSAGIGGFRISYADVHVEMVRGINDAPVIHVPGAIFVESPCQEGDNWPRRGGFDVPKHLKCNRVIGVETLQVEEDTQLVVNDVRITDEDLNEAFVGTLEVMLSTEHGMLELTETSGLHILMGKGDGSDVSIRFKGGLDAVNTAMATIIYIGQPNFNGADHLRIWANDQGYTGAGSALMDEQMIPINVTEVNDPPKLLVPSQVTTGPYKVNEDGHALLSGIKIFDEDENIDGYGELRVLLAVSHGRLSLSNTKGIRMVMGDATMSVAMEFIGRLPNVNEALAELTYFPDLNWNSLDKAPDRLELIVDDLGQTGALEIAVLQPYVPLLSKLPSLQVGGIFEAFEPVGLVDATSLWISVIAENDAPVISMPGATYAENISFTEDQYSRQIISVTPLAVDEDKEIQIAGVSVRDVDVDDCKAGSMTITVAATHGTVTVAYEANSSRIATESVTMHDRDQMGLPHADDLSGLVYLEGTGRDDARVVFTGSQNEVNEALRRLRFRGARDWSGTDTVSISVSDNGFTCGARDVIDCSAKTDTQNIEILVYAVNDPPVVHVASRPDGRAVRSLQEEASVRLTGTIRRSEKSGFPAPNYKTGFELWRSEGVHPNRDEGSWVGRGEAWRHSLVSEIRPGMSSSSPAFITNFASEIFFSANNGALGDELWRSNGTESGTLLVKDIFPGARGSNPSFLTVHGDKLYFGADGIDTTWMLRTDGCGGFRASAAASGLRYAISKSDIWDPYKAYDCPAGYFWASSSQIVALFGEPSSGDPPSSTEDGRRVYSGQCGWEAFEWEGKSRRRLRFSDSVTSGMYYDVGQRDGEPAILDQYRTTLIHETSGFAGVVCLKGDGHDLPCLRDPLDHATGRGSCHLRAGKELWVSDGTERGTSRVVDIAAGLASSNPRFITSFKGSLFFQAYSRAFGAELWRSDGTNVGTAMVEDISDGYASSSPKFLTVTASGAGLFFQAEDRWHGPELWWTDGVANHASVTSDNDRHGHNVAVVGEHGGAGTRMVLDIQVGSEGSAPSCIVALRGNTVLFAADDGLNGRELWISDSTTAGTTIVRDLYPGPAGSNPDHLVVFEALVYFAADDGVHGTELWVSNGTPESTRLVSDIFTGSRGSWPAFLTVFTPQRCADPADKVAKIYFTANERRGLGSAELWRTDGTDAGTARLFDETAKDIDLDPRTGDAYPARLSTFAGSLYYSANRFHSNTEGSTLPSGFQSSRSSSVSVVQSIVIEDVDAGTEPLTVTLSCSKGELSLEGATKLQADLGLEFGLGSDGVADRTIVFRASVAATNVALRGVTYRGILDQNGLDKILVTVNDTANTGEYGTTHVVTQIIDVILDAVNDAPILTAPATVFASIAEGYFSIEARALILGVQVADTDIDETHLQLPDGRDANGMVTTHLSLTNGGRISLERIRGLTFTAGSGSNDKEVRFTASLKDTNDAMLKLLYICSEDAQCMKLKSDELTIHVSDNGYTGEGGTLTDNISVEIQIK